MNEDEIQDLLMKVALKDDHASFKRLYLFFWQRLYRLSESIIKSGEDAEEVVDDIFINLWLNRIKLTEVKNLTVFLYVSVKNRSLNELSKLSNNKTTKISELEIQLKDFTPSAEEKLMLEDLTHIISVTVNSLPTQCRMVYKMVKEDGLKYKEVSEILNISVKTVEYHMGNALKKVIQAIPAGNRPYILGINKKVFSN